MIQAYLTKNWRKVAWLHDEMTSRIVLLEAQGVSVSYFFVCSRVWAEEKKFIKFKKERRVIQDIHIDTQELDLESALSSLKGVIKEVATMLSLGHSNTSVMHTLNINNYKLNLFKERLKNDRKFINKIKPC